MYPNIYCFSGKQSFYIFFSNLYGLCYVIDFVYSFPAVSMEVYKPCGLFCLAMISGGIGLFNSSFCVFFSFWHYLGLLSCSMLYSFGSFHVKLFLEYVSSISSTASRQQQKQNVFLAV